MKSVLLSVLFTLSVSVSSAFAASDVGNFEIQGFKLGMNSEQAIKLAPKIELKPIRPDGKTLIGYTARTGNLSLSFTREEFGKKIFNIQYLKIYPSKPDTFQIFQRYVKKYGNPDYSGRQMFHLQACWGRCFGPHKKMEFRVKIAGIGNKPFPLTLILTDPKLEKKNRKFFFAERDGET